MPHRCLPPKRSRAPRTAAIVLALACCSLGGCLQNMGVKPTPRGAFPNLRADWRPEVLNTLIEEYAADFAAIVEDAADEIIVRTESPEVRRNALLWKLNAIPEMRRACFRSDPLGATTDAWAFTLQIDAFFAEDGAGSDVFASEQPIARAAIAEALDLIDVIVDNVARSPEAVVAIRTRDVTPWVEENRIESLSFARRSSVSRFAELVRARGGTLDQLASIEELATSVSTQVREYAASAGKTARWEIDLMLQDRLGDLDLSAVTTDLDSIARSLERAAAAGERATAVAESTPDVLRDERIAILADVDRQLARVLDAITDERIAISETITSERAEILEAIADERTAILDAISEERDEVLGGLSAERVAVLDAVEVQRLDTLAWLERRVAAEREAISAQVDEILSDTVDRGSREIAALVDVITLRIILLIAGLIVIAPIVAHVYARIWPRRAVRAT